MRELPAGLYELLHTAELHERLEQSNLLNLAVWKKVDLEDLYRCLATPLSKEIAAFLSEKLSGKKDDEQLNILTDILNTPDNLIPILQTLRPVALEMLQKIKSSTTSNDVGIRPDTPLSTSALFTGSSRSPALRNQIIKEIASCDRSDWLVAFIKYAGIVPLLPALRSFTQTPAKDGGPRLRVATTSYMGATDVKAIQALLDLPNTEIRVSYDTKRTRLHAKAYIFHRDTGFGSAYIGSANVSKAALDEGLEWTAKVSEYETKHLWDHAIATFESHWEDPTEFTACKKEDISTLHKAIETERGSEQDDDNIVVFDLRPYTYQEAILDDISTERKAGKNKHLVIAATGTGKTMIAAFDYKRFCREQGGYPRLLFVAHREEILKQARAAFRQILRDGSFGDLVVSRARHTQENHLFCTVQSWNSGNYNRYAQEYFDYVVLDEAHHGPASSYQNLISHIKPKTLLGLTATPERTDGKDIRQDFGGSFTHEIRLPEAIERTLLSPFHYYGIPDLEGLDFSGIAWKRGGYDIEQLKEQIESNRQRASWVINQTDRYVTDIKKVRGLGFCVSVDHAIFMADFCNKINIPALALHGGSDKETRRNAPRNLEDGQINFIFTADLYNEGVDIPCVDTVLFLRPTESLILFLQQFGRGLRIHENKSHLTVLDFIAPQHRNFNFAKRYQALSSRPSLRIDKQIESDMPYVPPACLIYLEKQAKEHVLNNIRSATANLRGEKLLSELRELRRVSQGDISLKQILDYLNLDHPDVLYKRGLPHILLANADNRVHHDLTGFDEDLSKGFRRLALMDDTFFIEDAKRLISTGESTLQMTGSLMHCVLWRKNKPENGTLEGVNNFLVSHSGLLHDLKELLDWLLENRSPLNSVRFKTMTGDLVLHASYTREQILLALGLGSFEEPQQSREGVLHVPNRKLDVFFADINKSVDDFSPTTMYEDYAITNKRFHWQSQSGTTDTSNVGRRYINHERKGYTPLLFIREQKRLSNGLTSPYLFAGPLKYRKHYGTKPISFIWELQHALPAKVMSWARRV